MKGGYHGHFLDSFQLGALYQFLLKIYFIGQLKKSESENENEDRAKMKVEMKKKRNEAFSNDGQWEKSARN